MKICLPLVIRSYRLPARSYLHHYVIDVPLTNRGRLHAYRTGKTLLANGYAADLCYTSPSLRCVQSADKILSGMGRKHITMQLVSNILKTCQYSLIKT